MFPFLPRILENFLHRPATRNFPHVRRSPFETARGHIEFDSSTCKFCTQCASACPTQAIEVLRQEKRLTFEPFRCINCAACIDACRFGSVVMRPAYRTPLYERPTEVHALQQEGASEEMKVKAAKPTPGLAETTEASLPDPAPEAETPAEKPAETPSSP